MKIFFALLALGLIAIAVAVEEIPSFKFPPFAKEDVVLEVPYPNYASHEEMKVLSTNVLRGLMANGSYPVRRTASKELLERGDQETILRLVYSLKQGNVVAREMLSESTLAVVPYLMEDVANGSLKYYKGYIFGDGVISGGRVREVAAERVASILSKAGEFTEDTRKCLKSISKGRTDQVLGLSEKSRYLVEWWLLNKAAFEARKWEDVRPLPYPITYADPRLDIFLSHEELWDEENQGSYGSPMWELSEPFEAWAERIVDPTRRNLDFVALSWDGKKVIEHPAKSLDPRAKSKDRESRKTATQRNSTQSSDSTPGFSWIAVAAGIVLVLAMIRWMMRKPQR